MRSKSASWGGGEVVGSVRRSPISRRTEVSVSTPAVSMSASARSAGEPGSAPLGEAARLGQHDDAGDVVADDVVELPGELEALVLAGLLDARPPLVLADVDGRRRQPPRRRGARASTSRGRPGWAPGPARSATAPAATTTSAATGQRRRVGRRSTAARNTGITTSSVKNPNPGAPERPLVSASEITDAAVATGSTCRGSIAHAAPRTAIAPMASAASGFEIERPVVIQRSTSTAAATTTTNAILSTRRSGVAARARSTSATLTSPAPRTSADRTMRGPADNRLNGRCRRRRVLPEHAGHGHVVRDPPRSRHRRRSSADRAPASPCSG